MFNVAKKTLQKLAQASLRDRFKLTNLLLKPIQHVSQYSVILEELRKYIPEVARFDYKHQTHYKDAFFC
jgi:hypothetical protein